MVTDAVVVGKLARENCGHTPTPMSRCALRLCNEGSIELSSPNPPMNLNAKVKKGLLHVFKADARRKKDTVSEGKVNSRTWHEYFTYLSLLIATAITINQTHPSLGNVQAPAPIWDKKQEIVDAALAILVRDFEVLARVKLTGYPVNIPNANRKVLLSASNLNDGVLFAACTNSRLKAPEDLSYKDVVFEEPSESIWPDGQQWPGT